MKANELMIGDLIIVKSNGVVPDSIMKIITLDTGFDPEYPTCFAKPICEYEDCDNELGLDELKPIPLTPEILEENGYFSISIFNTKSTQKLDEKTFKYAYIYCENYYIAIGDPYTHNFQIHIQGINCNIEGGGVFYVHELQHALRLCGLNELADNFKV